MPRTIEYTGAKLYPKQRAAMYDPARISVIEASPQPLDATVYTPTGPRRFGDLEIGDLVCTPSGTASVKDIFRFGRRPVFRIVCGDGSETRATGDHRWTVRNKWIGERTVSTAQIAGWAANTRHQWQLPTISPIAYESFDVPLDPWLVGFLIGDGCLASESVVGFSTADAEAVARVARTVAPQYEVVADSTVEYRFNLRATIHGAARVRANGNIRFKADGYEANLGARYLGRFETREAAVAAKATAIAERYGELAIAQSLNEILRALGLLGKRAHEKRIPEVYRYNDEQIRLEVLRGILDSDGSASARGFIVLEQTSEGLALDVQELVEGLGGVARLTRQDRGNPHWCPSYRLNIRHCSPSSLFWLPRKKERAARADGKSCVARKIMHVIPDGKAEVQCIELADDESLYLTDHALVTHNTKAGKTFSAIDWLLRQAFAGRDGRNYWWVAPVYEQAAIAFRRTSRHLKPLGNQVKTNQSTQTITLPGGQRLVFKSAERPDDLYGEDVWAVVMDEASRMREEAWHALRSTLTKTRGPVRMIGNVKGRKNFFYALARAAENGEQGMAYHKITCWDAVEAGVLSREEIEESYRDFARLGREGVWRQLYMAEAGVDSDNPFGLAAIEAAASAPSLSSERPLAAGVDLAGRGASNMNPAREREALEHDYTAIVLLDKDGCATYIDRFQRKHTETENEIIARVGRTQALIDSTGTGDAIVERLQRRGDMFVEGYTFTERSRQDLLEHLALMMGEGAIHFPDEGMGHQLKLELESFEYDYKRTGVRFTAAADGHDDLVFALALAAKKLPWRRNVGLPVGMKAPGGSRWLEHADDDAWRKYQASLKPGTSPEAEQAEAEVALPFVVTSSGSSRWSGADR